MSDLCDRLRGKYAVTIADGAGPLDGSDRVVREFFTPAIQHRAAEEIERLQAELTRLKTPHPCAECVYWTNSYCENNLVAPSVIYGGDKHWLCGHWQKKGTK